MEKAANKFMSIQKAYETLSDPEKKRNYDMTGFADPRDAYKSSPEGAAVNSSVAVGFCWTRRMGLGYRQLSRRRRGSEDSGSPRLTRSRQRLRS